MGTVSKPLVVTLCCFMLLSLSGCGVLDWWRNRNKMQTVRPEYADQVFVDKSERTMSVLGNGMLLAQYSVSIGPVDANGHKMREGDKRTPEGVYTLDFIKEDSAYYRAFHISYPDAQDRAAAAARGDDPGGEIFVHGQPNGEAHRTADRQAIDWTAGCIAVTNDEMDEFISLVPVGTPITIQF